MARSRNLLTAGALGVAAVALIGAGATATFTATTDSTQRITAGKLAVALSSPQVLGCTLPSDGCTSLTLPPIGSTGSTFLTTNDMITLTNTGSVPLYFDGPIGAGIRLKAVIGKSESSEALLSQLNVCIKGEDASGSWVEGNGPLKTAVALRKRVAQNDVFLAPGGSAKYGVDFYAGQDSPCGRVTSDGTNTAHAWGAPSAGDETFYKTPESLTNAAMGGAVTPTLTFSFKE